MLYRKLLAHDFERLPRILRDFHSVPGGGRARGQVEVRHDSPLLARLVGFPPRGENIPLRLEVAAEDDREIWTRWFGESKLRSVQEPRGELLLESMGSLRMFFRLHGDASGMRFECLRTRWWIIPIPLRIEATVRGLESSWEFEVSIAGIGSYSGAVVPTP